MVDRSFPSWPSFTNEEADAVSQVLLSNKVNYWTGKECRTFEKEFAEFVNTEYAVSVANGTVALDLALIGLGIGSRNGGSADDQVVVTPRTFLASVSCIVNAGATPVFADVDINTGNINADTISAVLTTQTKAIIAVHLAGWPCDMDPIIALARKHNIKVIEDCAQAHGAKYKGRQVGSIGDVAAWSFCQDKIMTTGGEGGMVTTNNSELWSLMWSYKDHGKDWSAVHERQHPPGFRWLHESFGTNWRMTEMQAIIGRIQLKRLTNWIHERHCNAISISKALLPFTGKGGVIRLPKYGCAQCDIGTCGNGCSHAYYKFYAYVKPDNLSAGWNRDKIVEEITSHGVPCFQGTCSEVYLEGAFEKTPWRPQNSLSNAKKLGETSLMFLVHPTLDKDAIERTQNAISNVLAMAQNL